MNILITGGTGFLGKALTKYYLENTDSSIVIFARSESKLASLKKDNRVKLICGDVKDYGSIYAAVDENSIDIIIHAAAMKRIDTCQENPIEAFEVNVRGTVNCIRVCKKLNSQLCFISTDKACEPCTTYGATKYLSEQLVRRESERGGFKGYVIRYGNVLDSTGSVLGIWENQFKENGKVEVRNKDMTRFFWKAEDSVKYIYDCLNSDIYSSIKNGHVFTPKLKSLNIYQMACHLYGKENVFISKCSHTEKIHESITGDYCSKDHVVHPKELI
jgi:UDP-N-acetylglucosamine 4,6-dehydratase